AGRAGPEGGGGGAPRPPLVPGSRGNALSGTTTSTSAAAHARSVVRQPSALTSAWPSGTNAKAPTAVPRSTRAIARPRASGYQSAATVMFVWLLRGASVSPPQIPQARPSIGTDR